MKAKHAFCAALLGAFAAAAPAWAEDLRAAMEADNAHWLAAYNSRDTSAFPAMYTQDAVVLPPGAQPATGREAIGSSGKTGSRRATGRTILSRSSIRQDGKYAYQVARWTVVVVNDTSEATTLSGNTVRIFEQQPDGTWLTKVHIFNVRQ